MMIKYFVLFLALCSLMDAASAIKKKTCRCNYLGLKCSGCDAQGTTGLSCTRTDECTGCKCHFLGLKCGGCDKQGTNDQSCTSHQDCNECTCVGLSLTCSGGCRKYGTDGQSCFGSSDCEDSSESDSSEVEKTSNSTPISSSTESSSVEADETQQTPEVITERLNASSKKPVSNPSESQSVPVQNESSTEASSTETSRQNPQTTISPSKQPVNTIQTTVNNAPVNNAPVNENSNSTELSVTIDPSKSVKEDVKLTTQKSETENIQPIETETTTDTVDMIKNTSQKIEIQPDQTNSNISSTKTPQKEVHPVGLLVANEPLEKKQQPQLAALELELPKKAEQDAKIISLNQDPQSIKTESSTDESKSEKEIAKPVDSVNMANANIPSQ